MSNYTPIVDFAAKDALTAGDPSKRIKGTEYTAELNAIATAITSKEDTANKGAASGYAPLTGASKLADSYLTSNVPLINGANVFTANQSVSGADAKLALIESDAAADNGKWRWRATAEGFRGELYNDADSAQASWVQVERTGTTVDSIALSATTLTWNGGGLARLDLANVFTNTATFSVPALFSAAAPGFRFTETDAAADNKHWSFDANGEQLRFYAETDAFAPTNWLTVDRTAGTVDAVNLLASLVTVSSKLQPVEIELGHASDTTLTRSSAGVVAVEGNIIPVQESGSYTGTLTGGTTSPTGTIRYERIGKIVTLSIPSFTSVTSNANTMTITGSLPASCQPARDVTCAYPTGMLVDNGVTLNDGSAGLRLATGSSTLTFYKDGVATGWTSSGVKAVGGMVSASAQVVYNLA